MCFGYIMFLISAETISEMMLRDAPDKRLSSGTLA